MPPPPASPVPLLASPHQQQRHPPPAIAHTIQDASPDQTQELNLVHKKLTSLLPAGLAALSSLQVLDASHNPHLRELPLAALPRGLRVLRASGCNLSGALPARLGAHLPCLEQLVLAANHISQADAMFECPRLVHVCLAYNCVGRLSTSSAAPSSRLASVDLAHTDIAAADLPATLAQLARLPALRALSLQGTPASLLAGHRSAVLQQLPGLVFLDGQVVGVQARAAAATTLETKAPDAVQQQQQQQQQQLVTLQLQLSGLRLADEAAASARPRGDARQHSPRSPLSSAAALDVSPLHPVTLHLEFTGPDGSGYCSTALVVQQPAPPPAGTGAPAAPAPDLGAAAGITPDVKRAASSASPSKVRPGSSAVRLSKAAGSAADALTAAAASKASSHQPTPRVARQELGCLKLPALQVPASLAVRDFLRSGFQVQLIRTHHAQQQQQQQQQNQEGEKEPGRCSSIAADSQQQPQQPAHPDAATPKPARTGGPQSSNSSSSRPASGRQPAAVRPQATCVQEAPPACVVQVQAVLGTAHIAAPGLLAAGGGTHVPAVVEGEAVFVGEQPLMHPDTHIRLTLAEARAMQHLAPVGSCEFRIALLG